MIEADFEALDRLRSQRPLIHCISNIVTAADCANLLLAAGGRPVMAQEPAEMAEITGAAQGCVLNTGTPDDNKFLACRLAGQAALAAGRPVVLDPVGAGASSYRRQKLTQLLEEVRPTLIRANLAEVQALLCLASRELGVDSPEPARRDQAPALAGELARRLGCLVLLSGESDCVTDGRRAALIEGGSGWMSRITGAGCMLSVLTGAFLAVSEDFLPAAAAAAAFWKVCGQQARQSAQAACGGTGSFHTALFDAASLLGPQTLRQQSRISWLTLN